MRKSCVIVADPVRFAEGDASLDSENFGSKKTRRHDVGGFSLFDVAASLLRETFDALWAVGPYPR
ncbi:hypothetical protein [Xanthomonas arboricola]|uniref:hypothetical protein n=1 Tax=Xanthomonas arboricola TaxID=56448 RepID=UPI0020192E7C|nr:hypothetical protein [Xanthomonas arboricola]UQQ14417.1 hypothetical protein KPG65_18385 [Xanthomonas arboricola pv. corylina]